MLEMIVDSVRVCPWNNKPALFLKVEVADLYLPIFISSAEADSITILVPATPVAHLLTWEERETNEVARQRAEEARVRFETGGLNVAQAKIGDGSPLLAIGDELRAHPGEYDAPSYQP